MIVQATKEHILALYDDVPFSMRAYAIVDNDQVLGVAGVYRDDGYNIAFLKLSEETNKREAVRLGKKFTALVEGKMVFACQDTTLNTSESLLTHFGFRRIRDDLWQRPGYQQQ